MLVIRLQRTGKRNDATFRIVVAEKHAAVKGKVLEVIGHYLPTREPVVFECKTERVTQWMEKGAKPSNTLARLLTKQGMTGLETYIEAYTKQSKRKVKEEEAPAKEARVELGRDEAKKAPKAKDDTPADEPKPEESAPAEEPKEEKESAEQEDKKGKQEKQDETAEESPIEEKDSKEDDKNDSASETPPESLETEKEATSTESENEEQKA